MALKYVEAPILYLAGSGALVGATSITVTTFTDIYGNVLTISDFGAKGYGAHEPDSTNAEAITFTGVTANANGTYTLTGVSSALAKSPYTETSGLVRQHAGGTKFVITDSVAFWNTFGNKQNDEVLTGRWSTTVTPSNANDLTPKSYIDGIAIAGSPDATTTTKGISKMSVAPASATSPISVGDNDTRVPTINMAAFTQAKLDALAGSGTPSGSNKFVTADTDALKELLTNKSTTTTLGSSDTLYPTQNAVKTYVDNVKSSKTIAVRTSQQVLGANVSETDVIANTSVPGGSLSAGRAIRFECIFIATANTGSVSMKVYYGGSAVGAFSVTWPNNSNSFVGHLVVTIAYVGASSQYIGGMLTGFDTQGTSAAASSAFSTLSTTSAVDESAAQNVKLTATGSANETVFTIQSATIHLI